ncbi:hypothetical protein, conserved [Leishmania lindenbergi]|uniref:Translin-associated factor X-interacting protein 1 N-terminal domain-containing protein n=1 Tax=Leishmania lindenbergi TaxID=651832 RepID=A0AAW3A3D9_9TRYP
MSGGGDVCSGTVAVCGLQYTTSPSLPSAVKAARDIMLTSSSTFPSIPGVRGSSTTGATTHSTASTRMDPFPQSTLQLYDSYYGSLRGTEPAMLATNGGGSSAEWAGSLTLPEDLSGIGPSARRLLQLDAAHQHQQRAKKGESKKTPGAPAVLPVASRSLPTQLGRSRAVATDSATAAAFSSMAPLPVSAQKCVSGTHNAVHASTATSHHLEHTIAARPLMLSSNITNRVHGGGGGGTSTIPAAAAPPPLVTQLQCYIKREIVLNSGGAAIPSAMNQLNPYREAFRALSSAFPAYASLLDDIQCAYDNAIQAQAELLTDAYSAAAERHVERMTYQEKATALHQQVSTLQAELGEMAKTLESRAHVEGEQQQVTMQKSRTSRTTDALELRRELEAANERVSQLTHNSQIDLEKILVLIGAVRECDRRLKDYERLVTSVMGQVSELDEFKRIAGEAQTELQQFRNKYSDYVPAADFYLTREYLAAELKAAQLTTRRWRRTAAVRGTQLEVMQGRLSTLEEDRESLVKALAVATAMPSGGEAHASSTETVLTPRPSWKRLYEQYPELAGYAADVGHLTTELDRDDDGVDGVASEDRSAARRTSASSIFALDLPTVKGPKETGLQVEYLVQRIVTLEGLLRTQRQEQPLRHPSRAEVVEDGNASMNTARANSEKTSQEVSLATKDKAVDPSAMLQHRNSRRYHSVGDPLHNTASAAIDGAAVPRLAPPLELPLLGLGYGTQIPLCWRASGVLPRRPVAPSTILSLVYHFFFDVLPTYLDQEDKVQQTLDSDGTPVQGGTDDLASLLYELLQSEMQIHEDLQAYDSVAHLMMNLERDGEKREWFSDALHLFLWIANGVMPPRIGVDAAVVVAQVKRDIRALAKELQTSRLRRQALSECLQPVLELKTAAEIAELRAALGGETTFNANVLCSDAHLFMQVLLVQECRAGMDLYVSFLRALTVRANLMTRSDSRAATAGSVAAAPKGARGFKAPSMAQLAEGDRVLSLEDVSAAILEVEPRTPEVMLRELSLNAVGSALSVPTLGDTIASKTDVSEEPSVVVRLSDMERAIRVAPLIRHTVRSSKEDWVL